MRLYSIYANRHIFEGSTNGKPLRLLFKFAGGPSLRTQVAGDGEGLVIDNGLLDEPFDMDECGQVDVAEVAQSLFPQLCGADVTEVRALVGNGKQVGLKLYLVGDAAFHLWVDGDEMHWGDEAALNGHHWLDRAVPTPSERIAL